MNVRLDYDHRHPVTEAPLLVCDLCSTGMPDTSEMTRAGVQTACDMVGGAAYLAAALDVSVGAVSQWLSGHRRVPVVRAIAIEALTNGEVICEELRPDVPWSVLRRTGNGFSR